MSQIDNSAAWFELRTQRGNTIVMKDDELPAATKGRIYLFNTERGAIVEYDPTIVSPKLFELDDAAQANAEAQFGSAWLQARKEIMKKHGKQTSSDDDEPAPQAEISKEELDGDIDMIDSDDDDLFDEDDEDDT